MNNQFELQEELSLQVFFGKFKKWLYFLKNYKIQFIVVAISSVILSVIYSNFKTITYTSRTVFVVEEGKNTTSGLSGLASLAGQFGVDVGGGANSGLLSGDNILLYFKSNSLSREVLLSQFDSLKNQSFADKYIEVYNLKKKWEKNLNIKNISFPIHKKNYKYSRVQDSLLYEIIERVNDGQLNINKVDKKASFIEISVTMIDEMLAKEYCERLLNIGVKKFISVKIERQKNTVDKLQARVDSIFNLLNKKTISSASLQASSNTLDINPLFRSKNIFSSETTMRDKTMLATIYSSVVQNLEIAKFSLSQETPVIQIIDSSNLPLKVTKPSFVKNALYFLLIFELLFLAFISFKYFVQIVNNN